MTAIHEQDEFEGKGDISSTYEMIPDKTLTGVIPHERF